jgi:putative transposase
METVATMVPATGVVALCAAMKISRATLHRHCRKSESEKGALWPGVVCDPGLEGATAPESAFNEDVAVLPARSLPAAAAIESDGNNVPSIKPAPKRSSPRALSEHERTNVLAVMNEDRFCNLAVAEVYATLLDEGRYLCSQRTMYRILKESCLVRERRNQLRHPKYVAPELMASRPNQLWSWDITRLKTFVKAQYFHLYVILDVFSRFVVGWMVAERESGDLAKALIAETCEREDIKPDDLGLHADNGPAMISQPVCFLLASLGVTKSHSRPHVSDDNPFSEAQFKTLKYFPGFPERFASLQHARDFLRGFFDWYNKHHHHQSLGLFTPCDVHHGLVPERFAMRAQVLDAAYAAHPERFVHRAPFPSKPPETVYINPPTTTARVQQEEKLSKFNNGPSQNC